MQLWTHLPQKLEFSSFFENNDQEYDRTKTDSF